MAAIAEDIEEATANTTNTKFLIEIVKNIILIKPKSLLVADAEFYQ